MTRGLYRQHARRALLVSSAAALAAACSQTSGPPVRTVSDSSRATVSRPIFSESAYGVSSSSRVVDGRGQVPKGGGTFKLGSPYKIAGRWYVPREEPGYDRAGVGSWYGDDFHGRKTANGEIFDRHALTAAHPTLPLPSYAYVTNLENGRTILVRVNDRGPYVNDRLIDLSHASARALGYENQGHARVRVRYAGRAPLNGDDRRERQYLAEQRWNGGAGPVVAAYRPPDAPVAPPEPFPAGTPGRWSPTAYRAALAGKPAPQVQASAGIERPPLPDRYRGPSALGAAPPPAPAPVYREAAFQPTAAASPGNGRAWVHVGMFRERSNAERMRRDLASLGPVEVAPMLAAGGDEVYRVRLGPMSESAAQRAMADVSQRGVGGRIVMD